MIHKEGDGPEAETAFYIVPTLPIDQYDIRVSNLAVGGVSGNSSPQVQARAELKIRLNGTVIANLVVARPNGYGGMGDPSTYPGQSVAEVLNAGYLKAGDEFTFEFIESTGSPGDGVLNSPIHYEFNFELFPHNRREIAE